MQPDHFRNRVVWITGASSGIGEGLAYAFSDAGARVILSARNVAAPEHVRDGCAGGPERTQVLPLDLAELETLADRAAEATRLFGAIAILVNNAGLAVRDLALNASLDVDRRVMTVNYFGTVTLTKSVLPEMLQRGSGQVVVLSSLSGTYEVPKLAAYSAAKHALHGFFDSLRVELRGQGVKITTVVAGLVHTPITINALTGQGDPTGRMETVQTEGISAGECARRILRAVAGTRREFYVGGPEGLTLAFHRWMPWQIYRLLSAHLLKRWRRIKSAVTGRGR